MLQQTAAAGAFLWLRAASAALTWCLRRAHNTRSEGGPREGKELAIGTALTGLSTSSAAATHVLLLLLDDEPSDSMSKLFPVIIEGR